MVIPVQVIRHRKIHQRDRITEAANKTRRNGAELTIHINIDEFVYAYSNHNKIQILMENLRVE